MDVREHGAHAQQANLSSRFSMYLRNHVNDCRSSFSDIFKSPVSTLMTLLVLGIALALPSGLHVMLKNTQKLTRGWDGNTQLTLFLKKDLSQNTIDNLKVALQARKEISRITFHSADEALKTFKEESGFGDAIAFLDNNPLPAMIDILPSQTHSNPREIAFLVDSLERIPEVDLVQLDLEWVRKFHAMLAVAEQTSEIVGVLFGLAVLLIVGNTIRLAVQNRKDEIEIIKLVGATDAFIQRPFLYTGIWYGLFASIIAWIIVTAAVFWIEQPVQQLVSLYDSHFSLSSLSVRDVVYLLLVGIFLGLAGSWISVTRHLKAIQPH